MFSEVDVQRFVGPAAFARAESYVRQGRVSEVRWSDDGTSLTGRVSGSEPRPYSVLIRVRRPGPESQLAVGYCDCPISDRCKHVGAVALEARRRTGRPDGTGWRRTLDPILEGLDPRQSGAALGLEFALHAEEGGQRSAPHSRGAGRSARSVAVRPVLLGMKGRWRRTGVAWRDFATGYTLHQYDDGEVAAIRELHRLLTDLSSLYLPQTWLPLDRVRSSGLWNVLEAVQRSGAGLITGGRAQVPLAFGETLVPGIDVARDEEGLTLRPRIATADGAPLDQAVVLLGEPAVGVATWPAGEPGGQREAGEEAVLTLAPFPGPVAPAAGAFLRLDDPIRVPRAEETAFLAEHFRRLATILPVGSADGSFAAPAAPVPTLGLTIDWGTRGTATGTWWWRYALPDVADATTERLPFEADGRAALRDTAEEQRMVAAVLDSGVHPERVPELVLPGTNRLRGRFAVGGAALIALATEVLPTLRAAPGLELEEVGRPPELRPAEEAPTVTLGTRQRPGERDWFDLEIDVTVGGDRVPLADVLVALARGDEFMVLSGGVYFPLEDAAFARLRDLIAEAREITDAKDDELRISRFQASLWDDLVELGVVARQAETWRTAAAAITGFSATGELEAQALPDGFAAELRPYQRAGYDWLCFLHDNRLGGVLADDMGLGKTVQSLALVHRVVSGARGAPSDVRPRFVVVAPTSVVPNWVAEAERFAPGLGVVGITQTSRKRGRSLAAAIGDADLVITSYALFRLEAEEYAGVAWAGMLLDEAQAVKNRSSATYRAVRAVDAPFKLAITGTPLENTVMDLWSILSVAAPGLFPSPGGFAEFYARPIERDGDAERLGMLRRRIRPLMLRRTKEAVAAELPPKVEQVLEVELGERQRAVYDRYLNRERQRVLGLIGEFDRNRFQIFRALTLLRQVALDAALADPEHAEVPSSKLDLLEELLGDALAEGHRVLVFSQFTKLLGRVRERLDAADIGYAYLDGTTRRRGEVIDRFRSGVADVFLISLKAGGVGLNLAEADYCILLDPWWNPATEAQAVDRAHRIGQRRQVHVYRLVAKDTIEEKVMALKAAKADLFDAVLSESAGRAGAAITADDVRELLA